MDMNMDGKTVIVAGLGVSGQSMMEVLGSRAGRVLGVDEKKPDADLYSFDHIDWDHVDLVMTSPVFNPRTPFILEAQRRGIPVMSEVELAWQLRVDCDATGHPAQLDWHHRYQWQDLHYGNDFGDVDGLRFDRTCCRQYRQSGVPCRSRSGK